ncbi:MAG: dephospho-CoA kinase [Nanoarchaeota archaeon]
MIVVVTGKIGSGKSNVAKVFSNFGYKLIDADKLGHDILKEKKIVELIIKKFNEQIENLNDSLVSRGNIDRKVLGNIVFNDSKKLKKLNDIIHPYLKDNIKKIVGDNVGVDYVIDAALFYELELDKLADVIIGVKCDIDVAFSRQNKYDKKVFRKIFLNQRDIFEIDSGKIDYIIDTTYNDIEDTTLEAMKIVYELRNS